MLNELEQKKFLEIFIKDILEIENYSADYLKFFYMNERIGNYTMYADIRKNYKRDKEIEALFGLDWKKVRGFIHMFRYNSKGDYEGEVLIPFTFNQILPNSDYYLLVKNNEFSFYKRNSTFDFEKINTLENLKITNKCIDDEQLQHGDPEVKLSNLRKKKRYKIKGRKITEEQQ